MPDHHLNTAHGKVCYSDVCYSDPHCIKIVTLIVPFYVSYLHKSDACLMQAWSNVFWQISAL